VQKAPAASRPGEIPEGLSGAEQLLASGLPLPHDQIARDARQAPLAPGPTGVS